MLLFLSKFKLDILYFNKIKKYEVNTVFYSSDEKNTENTASALKAYSYRLVAEDEVPLQSASNIVQAKPIDNGWRAPIQNYRINLIQYEELIFLQLEALNRY